jgi:hypothetical protein
MTLFRLFLATCLVAIVAYTSVTIANHGWNLLPVFFADMADMGWAGQFNLDFMTFLALSAIWVAWRHQFSAGGLGLAVLAFFGGMLFLSIYLLVQIQRTGGDVQVLLLGPGRAQD